jgi:hypothetical protein
MFKTIITNVNLNQVVVLELKKHGPVIKIHGLTNLLLSIDGTSPPSG